ncbi:hypothetical protein C8Q75DRAFT_455872 [Abortiporus biennis]|nr:hypothetical protein C8Q75DRAFT_455872 [Abortiporus biennis]
MSFSSPPALHSISSSAHDAYSQDSDDYMDQPADNVPASSSPVSSSPPWPATPPDTTNQANSSVVPGSPTRKLLYASETGASSYFSSLPGTRDTTADTKNTLNRSDGHVGDVDTDSTQDFEDSEDDEEYWDNDEDSGASSYPRSLESRAAQTVFSSQLNALLEEVLRSRHVFEESNSGSLGSGSQPLPSVDSSGSSQQSKILASHYFTSSLGSGLESYTRTIASNMSSMPRSSSSSSAEVLACIGSPHLSVSCTVSPDFNSLSPTISRVSRQMMAFKADHEDEEASPSSQCSEESKADENRESRPSVLHVSSRISAASRIPLRTPSTHVTNRPGIPSAPKKIPQKVGYNMPAIQAPKRHHPDSADVRVIHPSLSTPQSRLDAGTQQTVEIAQPLKKRKITSESKTTLLSPFCLAPDGDTTTSTSNHFRLSSARAQSSKDVSKLFSTKPASLRKAASLRSESSFSGDEVPKALRTIVEEEEEKTPMIIHKGGPSAAVRRDFPAVSNARPSTTNDIFPPTQANFCAHLRPQLEHSPDTRWHATHLFTRYFVQLGISPSSSPIAYRKSSEKEDMNIDYDGEREIVWDVAVACLAWY